MLCRLLSTQLEENMDDSNIDVEGVSGNQEDWSGEWNDLDKNIQDHHL